MPVSEMKKFYVAALKKDKQKIVEYLQRQEAVELAECGSAQSQIFLPTDGSGAPDKLQVKQSQVRKALDIIDAYSPEKTSLFAALEGKSVKTVSEYEDFQENYETVLQIAEDVCAAEEKLLRTKEDIKRLDEKKESLLPWLRLNAPLNFSGTKHTSAVIGSLPQSFTQEELESAVANLDTDPGQFAFHILSSCKEQTCLLAISIKHHKKELLDVLSQLQFSPPPVITDQAPQIELELLGKLLEEKNKSLKALEEEIVQLSRHKNELRFLSDYLSILSEKYTAFENIGESEFVFLLTGYIPAKELGDIKSGLEKRFTCVTHASEITDDDDVPSLMENDWFSQPVEGIVSSYNYPKYKELDPTKVTSIFYYFMFGLMFSDACYGAILAASCGGLILKFKNMNDATSKFLRLFFWCGISTLVWGIVFSSYFGDVVDVFSATFLGERMSIPPLWFAPLEDPMRLLLFCLAIGIVHLSAGYFVKLFSALRDKDLQSALYDAVAPVMLLYGLLAVFVGTEIFRGLAGFSIVISPVMANLCLGLSALCALTILLTSGRESKNWIKRLLKGAFGLYNVLAGWISDILSYSRLLALGLATGVIASVINTLAAMPGKSFLGIIVFFIIFAVGHAMNFGINILGSYVHSNRLEYVEFFGKFYDGGGRKFRPLSLNTKYYTVEEEN